MVMLVLGACSVSDVGWVEGAPGSEGEPPPSARSIATFDVSDDFDRADSLLLGNTDQGLPWIEAGGPDAHARILGSVLSVHYFDPVSIGVVHANVGGYQAPDLDLTVRMKGHSTQYMSDGRFFGPSWRMADADGTWNSAGYHLRIEAGGLAVAAGDSVVTGCEAAVGIDDDWHEYRVVAVGRRHRVFMDDVEWIDCYDSTFMAPGFLGLCAYYSIFEADDLEVRGIEPPPRTYPQRAEYSPHDRQAPIAIGDDFGRADADALGVSDGGITWIEQGDGDEHVSIRDGRLRLHYFSGGAIHPHSWAVMDGPELRDVELRGRARGYDQAYMTDRPFGFSYRLQGAGVDHDDPGYHVLISTSGVELRAGAALVASWAQAVDPAWHDYRAQAVGDRHRVFMDGQLVIDATDATYPDAGRMGVAGYYSISYFDHVSARALPLGGVGLPVADDFERSDDDALGRAGTGITWSEQGAGDAHVGIANGRLRLHYFAGNGPAHPHSWAVMDGLDLHNVEIRGRARGHDLFYMTGRPFGFSYRLPQGAVDHDDPGYHVLISASGITLTAGATELATWAHPVDAGWHDYRVEAVGDRHRVFMDDALVIDVVDSTHLGPGGVGVAGYYSISYFEHVSARALPTSGVDPRTLDMTLLYLSVEPDDVDDVRAQGVNTAHAYLTLQEGQTAASASAAVEDYVSGMAAEPMGVLAGLSAHFEAAPETHMPPDPPSVPSAQPQVAAAIDALDGYGNVSAWYLPEELRYWVGHERQEGLNLRAWVELHDPERRPLLMYSPNHGTSMRAWREYEWADVVAGGAYAVPGTSQPLAWTRWRAQQMRAGILGDVHLGTDHAHGGRIPMILGWCNPTAPSFGHAEAYNLVFGTLAEGARGIGVWSYFWGLQSAGDCLGGYADAFEILADPTYPLGRALLHGTRDPSLQVTVSAGSAYTEPFIPSDGVTGPQTLPSVVATLVLFEGQRFIVAANSRDDAVTVDFAGAGRSGSVQVLAEGRTIPMTDGAFSDAFAGRAVHLYLVPSGSP